MPRSLNPEVDARWLAARITHGATIGGKETPEHYIWRAMLHRCRYKYKNYEHVKVCRRWHKYENFISDMGPRPSAKHSLDRWPDNSGNYEPKNCRWATASEQGRNRRSTVLYQQDSVVGSLAYWAETLKISIQLAYWRWTQWGTFVKGQKWRELKKLP